MSTPMQAVEIAGTIDADARLQLDRPLPELAPGRVRVIVLAADREESSELEWMQAASGNPAFEFLAHPAEDMYSITDGQPYRG